MANIDRTDKIEVMDSRDRMHKRIEFIDKNGKSTVIYEHGSFPISNLIGEAVKSGLFGQWEIENSVLFQSTTYTRIKS